MYKNNISYIIVMTTGSVLHVIYNVICIELYIC
jgi:hypothetical protein